MTKQVYERRISATYDDNVITVYQAFNEHIANDVISSQSFLPSSFKKDRMTWIKPSFCWMMYRSGWATKPNQERILSIQVKREGFNALLANACLASFEADVHQTHELWKAELAMRSVRIQWDPERDIYLRPIVAQRAIQVGITGSILMQYIQEWVLSINDITEYTHKLKDRIDTSIVDTNKFLTTELLQRDYPVTSTIKMQLGM